jgi:hypothetical protein
VQPLRKVPSSFARAATAAAAVVAALAAAVAVGGCSGSSAPGPAGSHTPSSSPSLSPAPLASAEARTIGIYDALLEHQLFLEPHLFKRAVIDPTPRGRHAPLGAPVRSAIRHEFERRIRITWQPAPQGQPPARTLFLTLPALPARGTRFTLAISDFCGNLCGHGAHYLVRFENGQWTAHQVGPMSMA